MLNMKRNKRIFSSILSMALIMLLVFPTAVFAEDEAPATEPAAEAPTAEAPAVEAVEAPAETPVEEPAVAEVATEVVEAPAETAVEEPVVAEVAVEGEALPEPAVTTTMETDLCEVVEALDEANLVMVNSDGEELSLASADAAEVLMAPDPIGCPAGVTPSWMGGTGAGCTDNYTSIQAAINDASVIDGWTVYVQAGTYNEIVTVNKSISLVGQDAATTIIQGLNSATNSSMSYGTLLFINSSDVTISGFTFSGAYATETNKYGATTYGIVAKPPSGTAMLSNITITDNIFTFIGDTGIQLQSVENSTINDNVFQRETRSVWYKPAGATPGSMRDVTKGGSGPGLWSSNNIGISNNSINTNGVGIFVYGGDGNQIIGNWVSGISDSGVSDEGIHIQSSTNAVINNNEVYGFLGGLVQYYNQGKSGSGIVVYAGSSATIGNNYLHDNSIGILLPTRNGTASPSVTIEENKIINNVADGLVNIKYPSSGSWAWWDISGNPMYRGFTPGDTINALYNFWGCDGGPGTLGCNTIVGNVNYDPWLKDLDGDGVFDSSDGSGGYVDNCSEIANEDQLDSDGDGIGNACDATPLGPEPGTPAALAAPAVLVVGPLTLIPVTGGELVALSGEFANTLQLPDGNSVIFNQVMAGYEASLAAETEETLPGTLPDGSTFASGMTLNLLKDGVVQDKLENGTLTTSFVIPAGMEAADFGILYWDAEAGEWVEISPVSVVDGFVTATVDYPGTFILVTK